MTKQEWAALMEADARWLRDFYINGYTCMSPSLAYSDANGFAALESISPTPVAVQKVGLPDDK